MRLWLTESQVCAWTDKTPDQVKEAAKDEDPNREVLVTRRLKNMTGVVYSAMSVVLVFKITDEATLALLHGKEVTA